MPPPKVNGYVWRQGICRAANTNCTARQSLRRALEIIEECHIYNSSALAMILTRAAIALGENLEAIRELEQITDNTRRLRGWKKKREHWARNWRQCGKWQST